MSNGELFNWTDIKDKDVLTVLSRIHLNLPTIKHATATRNLKTPKVHSAPFVGTGMLYK